MAKTKEYTKYVRIPAYTQTVYSEPRKIWVERYLTAKGKRLLAEGRITKSEASKYSKNRYKLNPNAKPIRIIHHDSVVTPITVKE